MGGAAAPRISEMNVFEGDGRSERDSRRRACRLRRHQRLGGEQRVDAGAGRLADHALVQHRAQVAQRTEYLGPGHQHDQQRLEAHLSVRHPPYAERQRRRGTDRNTAIGDAAGHHAEPQYAQGAGAELAGAGGEPAAVGGALAERLQRRQSLDAVEKLRAERLQRLLAVVAAAALVLQENRRRDQCEQRKGQHHPRHRHVPEGDEDKDRQGCQHRDRQLRHVLAEKALQLLDAVDDRQHDPAGALAGEPGRPQLGELVVEAAAQILLHAVGGAVRDHGTLLLDPAAQDDGCGHPDGRQCHRSPAGAAEHLRQQHTEQHEPGDADHRGDQPHQDRRGDPPAQPACKRPQASVEMHRRHSFAAIIADCRRDTPIGRIALRSSFTDRQIWVSMIEIRIIRRCGGPGWIGTTRGCFWRSHGTARCARPGAPSA